MQLLHTLKIRSSDGNHTLLNVIKNPITKYLPANTKKYGEFCILSSLAIAHARLTLSFCLQLSREQARS